MAGDGAGNENRTRHLPPFSVGPGSEDFGPVSPSGRADDEGSSRRFAARMATVLSALALVGGLCWSAWSALAVDDEMTGSEMATAPALVVTQVGDPLSEASTFEELLVVDPVVSGDLVTLDDRGELISPVIASVERTSEWNWLTMALLTTAIVSVILISSVIKLRRTLWARHR